MTKLARLSLSAFLLAGSVAESAPPMQLLSGSYVGDGTDDRFIYVGFEPDVVFLDRDAPSNPDEAALRTSTMPAGMSKFFDRSAGALALVSNVIQSFDPGGFTVGSDTLSNASGITFHWVAFKASPGELEIGTYTGNGASQNITSLSFSPAYVISISAGAHNAVQKSSSMPAGFSMDFIDTGYTDAIDGLLPTGFSVGSNARVNANGTVYHYVAWAPLPGRVAVGTYVGDATDDRNINAPGFFPEWVIVNRSSNAAGGQANSPVHKPASSGVNTDRALLLDNNVAEANNIQLLTATGFQVGSHTRVNDSAAPNFYHWMAFGPHRSGINYRSIGTNAGNLHAVGMASVPIGSRYATFTSALPAQNVVGAVGMGDVLTIQGEVLYIEAYLSPTQVLLQSEATVDHGTPTSTFTVTRAFNTLSSWESARDNDLVAQDVIEVGVAYKDGPFQETLTIDAVSSDATHYMHLTVAPGQRHNGTGGTGATLDGQYADRLGIQVQESNTIVEWLEVTNHGGATGFPSIRVQAATNVLFQYLLVHDFPDPAGNTEGIAMRQGQVNGMTVRNSMIFNGDAVGIEGDDGDDTLIIENCTIYNMDGNGIDEKNGTPIVVRNTIAMGNNGIDFDITVPGAVEEYNMSDDGTASCPTCKGSENPLIQFVNAGTDHHLAGTSTAIDAGTDLSSSFCCDIDAARRTGLWDMGADELGAATAVDLVSFAGTGEDGAALLEWETGSELDNLGFHLYRASAAVGPYERVTSAFIPGLGSSPVGATYRHRDSGLANDVTYFYRLEDIDTRGGTTLHGPVAVTPRQGAAPSEPPVEVDEGEGSYLTFGVPEKSALRVVRRDRFGVTLELDTGGFYAVPDEKGWVRLEIPGLESLTEEGKPGLPVARSWVEAVAGRKVVVQSVWPADVVTFSGLRLSDAALPELEAFANGTVRAGRRRSRRSTGPRWGLARAPSELYPRESARLVSVGFQGEVKKALVELAPVRWDGATGRVELARRLRVRLSFQGRDRDEGLGRRVPRRDRAADAVAARLATREPGLYAVRFEDVLRGRAVSTRELRLSRQGETVPYHLDAPTFGRGATLYFVSEGGGASPYGQEAVYELELGAAGAVMEEHAADPAGGGAPLNAYRHRVTREENLQYQPALLDAPDIWLWDLLFAPVRKSYSFEVSALASSDATPPRLRLSLQGASDFAAIPDHHVRVYVNGALVAEDRWDGKEPRALDVELPAGALLEGTNQLELENVGDTTATYSMFLLNRFSLDYSRRTATALGSLRGRFLASGTATLSGLASASGASVVDTSGTTPRWLVGARWSKDGTLRFAASAGHEYLVVSPESVRRPVVSVAGASRWRDTRHGADYLVIGPRAFLPEAAPLLRQREEQGLRVEAIPVEELYDEFGFGEPSPEAIKKFLSHAYHEWQRPAPRYVLLVGDATYDFKGTLGAAAVNRVPPRMVRTSYLWTASDPSYAAVNGDDILPDLALGRLPAASSDELRVMVGKILAFESGGGGLDRDAFMLVADNPDVAGNFVADANALAASVLASRHPEKVYLSDLGLAATRAAIATRFDEGASLVSYIGHGGIHVWADENLLDTNAVQSFGAQSSQPLLLTMNCLNGYFHFPYFDSLAEGLVKADSKGAIAAFSPSGLSLNGPANLYHRALLEALLEGGHERLGDAVLEAQAAYAASGAFPELLSIYNLLGDPALEIR